MDNDNILLQKAADIYRGLRFKMKYRGVDILPAGAGNDLARELLESGQPFLFGRCGATEMRTVADYLQNGGKNFDDRTREDIRNLSGVFPTDDATLEKFCRLRFRIIGRGSCSFNYCLFVGLCLLRSSPFKDGYIFSGCFYHRSGSGL